jgi:DNA-binding transcriptional LysR family regulator
MLLCRYLKANPGVDIIMLNVPQAAQLLALRQRRILITFDRYLPADSDLSVEIVAQEPLVLALAASNPLAKFSTIPIGALAGESMVMARDVRHQDWVRDLCRAHGFEPRLSQLAGDMIGGIVMAANGFGVQIVPKSAQTLRLPGLVYRPLKSRARDYGSMELQCAYLKSERSPLLRGMLEVVRDYRRNCCTGKKSERGHRTDSAVSASSGDSGAHRNRNR